MLKPLLFVTFCASATYAQMVPTNFTSNLPIIDINTMGANVNSGTKTNVIVRIIDNASGANNKADSATYYGYAGMKPRGNYSSTLPQTPYSFDTWTATQTNLDTSILGLPKEHDWNLIANYNDKAFFRNPIANNMFANMGHYAAKGKLTEVIINNNYVGVYYFCEAIKRGKKRVSVAKLTAADTSGIELTGGYIWKNDFGAGWTSNFTPLNYPLSVNYAYHYPAENVISTQQATYIKDYVNAAETALYAANFADPVNGYRKYLSMTSFYDYFIVNEVSRNNDGFKKSVYFHKDKDSGSTTVAKIKMGPVWDFDWAWKNINECVYGANDGSQWAYQVNQCFPDNTSFGWYERLLQDSTFANGLRCRYTALRATVLDTSRLFSWIDSSAAQMDSAQSRHYTTYQILGQPTGAPENDSFPTTYLGEVAKFKQWIRTRITWLDNNMYGNTNNCNTITTLSHQAMAPTVLVFPNPATNYVFVESGININKVELLTTAGIIVQSKQCNATATEIGTTQLAQGMYILRTTAANGAVSQQKLTILR